MDLVIVPTFSRPEMLWNCLEHIKRCPDAPQIVVSVDNHLTQHAPLHDIAEVVSKFDGIRVIVRESHEYHGNSYNLLSAYRDALDAGAKYVFMVEDDVLVERGFFSWHYAVQLKHDPFCSIAVKNERSGQEISKVDYASLGVCFKRDSLKHIVNHATHDYYSDMRGYCRREFDKRFAKEDAEQDGLILRIMGSVNGTSIWPATPKAKHVGNYGYHRGDANRPQGTLEERFQIVKERTHCALAN